MRTDRVGFVKIAFLLQTLWGARILCPPDFPHDLLKGRASSRAP